MCEAETPKMTFRQGIAYIIRGFGIIRKLFPWYLTFSSITSGVKAVQPLVVLYFSARIIDELAGKRDLQKVILYAAITVGASFLFVVLKSVLSRKLDVQGSMNWLIMQRFRAGRYARMDYEYVEDSSINELLADIQAKENANGLGIIMLYWFYPMFIERLWGVIASAVLLMGIFSFTGNRAGSFITSSWSTVLLAVLIILPIVVRVLLMKRAGKVMKKVFELIPKTNSIFSYYYNYIKAEGAGKDIRIYNQQPSIIALIKERSYNWLTSMSRMESEASGFTAAANAIVSGFTYILIGMRALAGMYSIGQVTQYIGAVTVFSENLTGLISICTMMWENAAYLPMQYKFLDMPDIKYLGSLTTEKRKDNEYELEFHEVSFKYPGTEKYALKNLNLKLNIGERLAVVGMNGSGKTTMIKLLCRLYDPTGGYITLNGIDIRKYDYNEYMLIFSVVFQDFQLLAFPLGQNVAAAVDYDTERVKQSLHKVGFNVEAARSPGLETALYKDYDEEGVMVSGGEAQKIALARSVYKDAPFIILDEPTAALDPIAEFEIYSKFNEIVGDKTAIYISHRLSSCRFCQDIAVFHEGELIQRGSHDVLIADKDGKYYELWNAQAQYYTDDEI